MARAGAGGRSACAAPYARSARASRIRRRSEGRECPACCRILVSGTAWALARTRWGLRVRMTGEAPEAAATAGVPVERIRLQTMLLSGPFCGLGGGYLSLDYVSLFARGMTDERGLIALAAIFFARGRPFETTAVAVLFGAVTARRRRACRRSRAQLCNCSR